MIWSAGLSGAQDGDGLSLDGFSACESVKLDLVDPFDEWNQIGREVGSLAGITKGSPAIAIGFIDDLKSLDTRRAAAMASGSLA